jgi:hypothetical protein
MAGPKMRIIEKPIVFIATAFTASARATSSKAVVSRAGRSSTFAEPISTVKANSIHTLTLPSASATPNESDTAAARSWLPWSSRRRSQRSAATPESGASRNIGTARAPITAPSSAPEPVIS